MKKLLATLFAGAVAFSGAFFTPLTASAEPLNFLNFDTITRLSSSPKCELDFYRAFNMSHGFYRVTEEGEEDKDVWYFSGNGEGTQNPAAAFLTKGTKAGQVFCPVPVTAFSFKYRLCNYSPSGVVGIPELDYIVQVIASDNTYPTLELDLGESYTEWKTVSVNLRTPLYHSLKTYANYYESFCGFQFKMGSLDGELAITDIEIEVDPSYVPPESSEEESSEESSKENSISSESADESTVLYGSVEEMESEQESVNSSSETSELGGCSSTVVATPIVGATLLVGAAFVTLKRKK